MHITASIRAVIETSTTHGMTINVIVTMSPSLSAASCIERVHDWTRRKHASSKIMGCSMQVTDATAKV